MSDLDGEENDFIENGDLGLGLGLRPGGLRIEKLNDNQTFIYKSEAEKSTSQPNFAPVVQNKYRHLPFFRSKHLGKHLTDIVVDKDNSKRKPIANGISSSGVSTRVMNKSPDLVHKIGKDEIERKLKEAEEEVEELKNEIEVYHKRLDAKYRAIAILREQSKKLENYADTQKKRSYQYNHSLEKEVNQLHFELDQKEISLETSQAIWAERFDSVCRENSSLAASIEEKTKTLQKLAAQNQSLSRERDELLALLDVKEREKYMKTCSRSSDDEYNNYTSAEIAVLGACKCRVTSPHPCGCAHAAAHLRKEITKLKSQVDSYKKRKNEAMMTVDVYQQAFEEQLQNNKILFAKLTSLAVPSINKVEKAKAIFRFLLETLNDDDISHKCLPPVESVGVCMQNGDVDTRPLNDKELVLVLTQILHQRNEAFAHQKIASQVLTEKVKNLELQLSQHDEVFSSS